MFGGGVGWLAMIPWSEYVHLKRALNFRAIHWQQEIVEAWAEALKEMWGKHMWQPLAHVSLVWRSRLTLVEIHFD